MPIFIKENQALKNNSYQIPPKLQKHLKDVLTQYGQYKNSEGYKRLNNLVNPSYNKRNDKDETKRQLSFQNLKDIDYDMRHMDKNPNNIQRILNGGEEMAQFAHNTLERERTKVEPILKQKKVETRNKNATKPIVHPMKPIQLDNGKARLHESTGEDRYWEYISDYPAYEIFNMFEGNENPWIPLINPLMYQKALQEFSQYGQLMRFKKETLQQMMGIIMKNTAILRTTTEICGHSEWFPTDDFVDFYFEGNYDAWNEYKEQVDEESDYYAAWELLDERGVDDWNKLPDGSDALSDFGLKPLEELIAQYDESMTPEQILILINKCLDIVHCRGDLSSMFIEGGRKTLSQISENVKIKKIYITENQLKNLKNYL